MGMPALEKSGIYPMPPNSFTAPPPDRHVRVEGLGNFWGEAMATALLEMAFLAGSWVGVSVSRLESELSHAQEAELRAKQKGEYNRRACEDARRKQRRIRLLSIATLGIWWLVKKPAWPRPALVPIEVPRFIPVEFSREGMGWLVQHSYARVEIIQGSIVYYPTAKLVRETRHLWAAAEDE